MFITIFMGVDFCKILKMGFQWNYAGLQIFHLESNLSNRSISLTETSNASSFHSFKSFRLLSLFKYFLCSVKTKSLTQVNHKIYVNFLLLCYWNFHFYACVPPTSRFHIIALHKILWWPISTFNWLRLSKEDIRKTWGGDA